MAITGAQVANGNSAPTAGERSGIRTRKSAANSESGYKHSMYVVFSQPVQPTAVE